jgi:NTE family protein
LARGLLWYEQMQCRSVRTMPASDIPNPPDARQSGYSQTALVLQGGGALGAYQAGVYQVLSEDGCEPDWVCGISIGAINAAIIAGNEPKDRLPRLYARVSNREYQC